MRTQKGKIDLTAETKQVSAITGRVKGFLVTLYCTARTVAQAF